MSNKTAAARNALNQLQQLCRTGISVDPIGPSEVLSDFIASADKTIANFISVPFSLADTLTDHFDPAERTTASRIDAIKLLAMMIGKEVGTYQVSVDEEPEPAKPTSAENYVFPFTRPDDRVNRVYLSGPMTGIPDYNSSAFNDRAARLRELGLHVENPADIGVVQWAEWGDYMRYSLARMLTCDTIALLPGWSSSKGAKLELMISQALGMKVRVLDGAEPVPIQYPL